MRNLPFLLLLACPGPSKSDADTDPGLDDGDTDTDPPCTATVTGLTPLDGAVDVDIATSVVASFSEAVTAAEIEVDGGASGTVTVADDGLTAVWTPDAPLARDTTYAATASVCESASTTRFTTVGEAVTVDIAGRTYDTALDDSSDLEWVKPNAGSVMASQLATTELLYMVQSADDAEIDFVGAAGFVFQGEKAQYPCTYAIDFPASSFTSNPAFTMGPLDTEMVSGETTFTLFDLQVVGTVALDGESLLGLVITGILDTGPLSEDAGQDYCELASAFGDACIACPDDGEVECLELEVHDGVAPWLEGLSVDPDIDPSADRYCD